MSNLHPHCLCCFGDSAGGWRGSWLPSLRPEPPIRGWGGQALLSPGYCCLGNLSLHIRLFSTVVLPSKKAILWWGIFKGEKNPSTGARKITKEGWKNSWTFCENKYLKIFVFSRAASEKQTCNCVEVCSRLQSAGLWRWNLGPTEISDELPLNSQGQGFTWGPGGALEGLTWALPLTFPLLPYGSIRHIYTWEILTDIFVRTDASRVSG